MSRWFLNGVIDGWAEGNETRTNNERRVGERERRIVELRTRFEKTEISSDPEHSSEVHQLHLSFIPEQKRTEQS